MDDQKEIMEIGDLTLSRFDGDRRTGKRMKVLLSMIKRAGFEPYVRVDKHKNIWIEKESKDKKEEKKKIVLISSHFDVDHKIKRLKFDFQRKGNRTWMNGVLDNTLGCYINLKLLGAKFKNKRLVHVFTSSEEASRKNPRVFAKSAKEICKELKKRSMFPDLCIALDVTYPRFLQEPKKTKWHMGHEKLFDMTDETHCYIDGYELRNTRVLAEKLIKKFKIPKVKARKFSGHDEAYYYSKIAPSFAFGPVVYGHFDQPNQRAPFTHVVTAIKFLKKLLRQKI